MSWRRVCSYRPSKSRSVTVRVSWSGPGLLVVVAGGAGEVGGEGAAVGALGLELGFGTLGAGPFGLGGRARRGELRLAALGEGVTFAGGVGAELGCLVTGVGLGL